VFGLGWIELLVIAGVVSLLAGPVAMRKLVKTARDVHQLKSNPQGALDKLIGEDEEDAERRGSED